MGIETAVLLSYASAASAVVGAVGLVQGMEARSDAKRASKQQAEADAKIRSETQAQQAQRAADERRNQVREERVKRARILASSESSGASGSSGEFGAIGGLATNLSSNIGSNLGSLASGARTSELAQQSADAGLDYSNSMAKAQGADQLFSVSSNIFSASGGIDSAKSIFK